MKKFLFLLILSAIPCTRKLRNDGVGKATTES